MTFKNMFSEFQKSGEDLDLNEVSELEENVDDLLQNMYLQKTPYKIINRHVEHGDEPSMSPIKLIDSVKDFQSGQVYRVLGQDSKGKFRCHKSDNPSEFADKVAKANKEELGDEKEYLVYIENQQIVFNDELSTITYFKDITFGVLYEQIKAQQQLQSIIQNTI